MDRLLKYFEQRFNARMEKWTYHMCSMNFHEVMDRLVKSFFSGFGLLNLAEEKCCLKLAIASEH